MEEREQQVIDQIKDKVQEIDDVVIKEMVTDAGDATIIYFSSLIEKMTLQSMVFIPLANHVNQIFQVSDAVELDDVDLILQKLDAGQTLLFFHKTAQLRVIDTYSAPTRSITNTETESTVIGPQDAFTESLETNISLVKRRIQNPMLKNETRTVGTETNIKISILYIDNIVNKENLDTLRERINQIQYPFLQIYQSSSN